MGFVEVGREATMFPPLPPRAHTMERGLIVRKSRESMLHFNNAIVLICDASIYVSLIHVSTVHIILWNMEEPRRLSDYPEIVV